MLLTACEGACINNYNDCLNEAQQELDSCLSTCCSCDQECIDNCVGIHTLSATICATKYAICGLGCLVPFSFF